MAQRKLYSFDDHPEHKERLVEWAERWIAIALRTEPQGETDREACRVALRGLYRAADLEPPPPEREVFTDSPVSGAIAATIASCVWWLRENPDRHESLFGRRVSEAEIVGAIEPAVRLAVQGRDPRPRAGIAATTGATWHATERATDDATERATWRATARATYRATNDATADATYRAIRNALESL